MDKTKIKGLGQEGQSSMGGTNEGLLPWGHVTQTPSAKAVSTSLGGRGGQSSEDSIELEEMAWSPPSPASM